MKNPPKFLNSRNWKPEVKPEMMGLDFPEIEKRHRLMDDIKQSTIYTTSIFDLKSSLQEVMMYDFISSRKKIARKSVTLRKLWMQS